MQATPHEPAAEHAEPAARESGVWARFYFVDEPMAELPFLVPNQTPNVSVVLPTIDLASDANDASEATGELRYTFFSRIEGFLEIEEPGRYALRLTSDDGARLSIDGTTVIDHDGLHGATALGGEIDLTAGEHALGVEHFQCYGGFVVRLEWKRPSASEFELVPASALRCRAGEMRITSPGSKKVILPLAKGGPGDGLEVEGVHPSYVVTQARPPDFEPKVGGMDWLPDGRLLVATWDAEGAVYALSGVAGDDPTKSPSNIEVKKIARGLAEPLGLCTVGERIFVLQKQELTELLDNERDGIVDEYRAIASDWNVSANFHEFAFGLVFKDGWFYFNLAIAIDPGGKSTERQVAGRGSTLRVKLDDGTIETFAHGLRTPNGIGFGTDGELFVTDNQGDWLPSSKIVHLVQDAFYGSRAVLQGEAAKLDVVPPALWLPQNEIGNSPSQPARIPGDHGPYAGQMVHGDVTHGGLKRDFLEKVDGAYQGCVFRFTQGLEAGVNRVVVGPDGALYVGGIGSTGNWGQEGKLRFGLQRLAYVGPPAFEMLAVRARANGFEIELTQPLAAGVGWEPENYRLTHWRYVPTEEYGGSKVDEARLVVRSASVSGDRKKVFLEVDGLEPNRIVHVHLVGPLVSELGVKPWTTEAWYTLNRLSSERGEVRTRPPAPPQNVLTAAERDAGWRLLFDGRTTNGWRGFRQTAMPAGWEAIEGELVRTGSGGDIVTSEEFEDFELALEWKVSPGGNSGVFFRVGEDDDAVWRTGPEMQVLDNDAHADGKNPLTSAGSNYALHAPRFDRTRPIGLWNQARLVVRGNHVEHWLNGDLLLEYDQESAEWKSLVAASKFASMPKYGTLRRGRIALQDHGDRVAYRNLKLRVLAASDGD
ncbi:MAG: family 16 glycoside hydrolase [Planctomycetota bacterium]